MPRALSPWLLLLVLLGSRLPARAGEFSGRDGQIRLSPPRAVHRPLLDGTVDAAEWADAAVLLGFTENRPVEGRADSLGTRCLVMYDTHNLYVAFVCNDRPGMVQAPVVGRDNIWSGDWAGISIDSFHDRQRSYFFGANPHGIQADGVDQEGVDTDISPDFQFESRGRVTPQGYELEFEIPFRTLRFAPSDSVTFGFNAVRDVRHSNAHLFWAPVRRSVASYHQQIGDLEGMAGVRPGRNLTLTPFVTGSDYASRPGGEALPLHWEDAHHRQGLDLKLGLTSALTLDATLSPDFSQVESDAGVVDVNQRFAIFYAERRPFFLEGVDIFTTPLSLVYTRRIADPRYGLKVTGKVGHTAIGVLQATDRNSQPDVLLPPGPANPDPARNALFTIARARHDLSDHVSFGALLTDRERGPAFDRVGAADARFTFPHGWSLAMQAAHAWAQDPLPLPPPGPVPVRARPTSRAATAAAFGPPRALEGDAEHVDVHYGSHAFEMMSYAENLAPDFRADAGFIARPGVLDVYHWFAGHLYPARKTWYQSLEPRLQIGHTYDNGEQGVPGRLVDVFIRPQLVARLPDGSSEFGGGFKRLYTWYAGRAFGPGWRGFVQANSARWRAVRPSLFASCGSTVLYDEVAPGRSFDPNLELALRFNEQFDGTVTLGGAWIDRSANGSRYAIEEVRRLRLSYQFSRELSARWITDWKSTRLFLNDGSRSGGTTVLGEDLLFGYLLHPGTVAYLGLGARLSATDGGRLRANEQSVFMKCSYLWQM